MNICHLTVPVKESLFKHSFHNYMEKQHMKTIYPIVFSGLLYYLLIPYFLIDH